jgi:hypothetical protein
MTITSSELDKCLAIDALLECLREIPQEMIDRIPRRTRGEVASELLIAFNKWAIKEPTSQSPCAHCGTGQIVCIVAHNGHRHLECSTPGCFKACE